MGVLHGQDGTRHGASRGIGRGHRRAADRDGAGGGGALRQEMRRPAKAQTATDRGGTQAAGVHDPAEPGAAGAAESASGRSSTGTRTGWTSW